MDFSSRVLLLRTPPLELSWLLSSGRSSSPQMELLPQMDSAASPGLLLPRTSCCSSFLIRDILADRPAPYRAAGSPESGSLQSGSPQQLEDKGQDSGEPCGTVDLAGRRLRKPRKARTAFSEQQLSHLERSFQNQKYLNVQDRMELARSLQLSDMQVKTWYQNRRTKWKRQSVLGSDPMFLPSHYLYLQGPPPLDLYLYPGHAHHHPPFNPHLLNHS